MVYAIIILILLRKTPSTENNFVKVPQLETYQNQASNCLVYLESITIHWPLLVLLPAFPSHPLSFPLPIHFLSETRLVSIYFDHAFIKYTLVFLPVPVQVTRVSRYPLSLPETHSLTEDTDILMNGSMHVTHLICLNPITLFILDFWFLADTLKNGKGNEKWDTILLIWASTS